MLLLLPLLRLLLPQLPPLSLRCARRGPAAVCAAVRLD
jgi:hypothetical protein